MTEPTTATRRQHWDDAYTTKAPNEVSWFQERPDTSLRLIARAVGARGGRSVVDIGAGTATLVDRLLDERVTDLTVLDISAAALQSCRTRLGQRARSVSWVTEDVLTWRPGRDFDCWHDRAVLHFMVAPEDVLAYVRTAEASVGVGGALVLGTFAQDGPVECSGLPVARYGPQDLAELFAGSFDLEHAEDEEHVTPWGTTQYFTWAILRRRNRTASP